MRTADKISGDSSPKGGEANRLLRRVAREAGAQLECLRDIEKGPKAMDFFFDAMESVFIENDPGRFLSRSEGKQTFIGVYCIMAPEELIYAAGAIPLRLCGGCYESCRLGEDHVPRDGCPLAKSSMGFTSQGGMAAFDLCEVVIVPTTCDSKRKLAEELSRFKEVWMLEVPHIKDSEISRRAWLEQMYALKAKLEKYMSNRHGKKKITPGALHAAIGEVARAQLEMRRLLELRMHPAPPIWGRHAMLVANAYAYLTASDWTNGLTRLNNELALRAQNGIFVCRQGSPRILLAGSPFIFPNWKIPTLVEEMGGVAVCDESCAGDRYLYDPVGNPEKTLRDQMAGLASRYLMPCVCPSFAPNIDRLVKLTRMVDVYAVDGVIYHVLKGCLIYDFEVNRVEEALKERNIPLLRVETDYSPEDVEQLRTRVEAFMELLKTRKKKAQAQMNGEEKA
jgi:benzoyl-CoA reductase/2-hydroxyglutaryl-CoA dehydratase subunit BcrC/BadD/HgdB